MVFWISNLARETTMKLTIMSSDQTFRNSCTCTQSVDFLKWYSKLRRLSCSGFFSALTIIPATHQPLPLYPYFTTLSLCWLFFLDCLTLGRQGHCIPLKHWEPLTWHSVTSQKNSILSKIAVRTANLVTVKLLDNHMIQCLRLFIWSLSIILVLTGYKNGYN